MLESNDCNVVMCRDLNCKFCSTSSNTDTALNGEAYTVYTCESTQCKLCREETDVLLDLFCPFNTVDEIAEMTRKLNNIIEASCSLYNDAFPVAEHQDCVTGLRTTEETTRTVNSTFEPHITSCESSHMLREMLQNTPGQLKDKQGTSLEIIQNLKAVDESLLTDLERELQMDQLEDLPELKDVGICDLISR